MASQGYEIRLFDKRIASFTFETNCFGESCAVGLRVEPGADALAAIRAALPKDTADDVYKIILTGESFAAPDLAYFRQALEQDFFVLTFSDETVPPLDLWRRAGEDSLAGRFLRRMQRRIEAAQTEEEKKLLLRAVRCGIAALEGWEVRL